jgi:hypothetical protein
MFDERTVGVPSEVARVGCGLVVDELKPPHELDVGRRLARDAGARDLVVVHLLETTVTVEAALVRGHVPAVRVEHAPVGLHGLLGLERRGGVLLAGRAGTVTGLAPRQDRLGEL